MEVDTGSPALTLDERFMSELGLAPAGPQVRRVAGEDETGYSYVRYFAQHDIPVRLGTRRMPTRSSL